MINKPTFVLITAAANGFFIDATYKRDEGEPNTSKFVATAIKDSYSFGSVSVASVLDALFNPREESTDEAN